MNQASDLDLDEKKLLALFATFERIIRATSMVTHLSETEFKNTLHLLSSAYTDISLKMTYANTQTALAYNVRALLSLNAVKYQILTLKNSCKIGSKEYARINRILESIGSLERYIEIMGK